MTITRLDPRTIEQIAAGEVIESPASIVKELVENSIDANASQIVVDIKNGGKTYIRVTDNGDGISNDDIELAFEKHATSKISKFDDLYDIYSLGFRGEALASIVTVAEVRSISKTAKDSIGKKISYDPKGMKKSSIATNNGTSIEVTNLFRDIPARFKFLKSDLAETNAITKLMYSFAVGYHNIGFKYIKDGRIEFNTNPTDTLDIRITKLLDDNLADNIISIGESNSSYKISGLISSSNYYRGSRSLQYIFVNNRLIDSNEITATIEREYRSFIPQGRFPAFFVFITTNPKNLDVNVHPNKRTIKFNYEDELLDLISKSVYEKLAISNSPKAIEIKDEKSNDLLNFNDYSKLLDNFKSSQAVKEESSSYEDDNFFDTSKDITTKQYYNSTDRAQIIDSPSNISYMDDKSYLYLTSIFDRYSIFKATGNEIYILDHRRASESISFDSYVKQIENTNVASQMLIDPIIINLKADDKNKFNQKRDLIESLGFEMEYFGENKVIIRAIPIIFEDPSDEIIYDLLDLDIISKKEVYYSKLFKLVKKYAFRKGHTINKDTAQKLMENVMNLDNPFKTYEGKSIMIKLKEEQMEKYFDR